MQMFASFSHSFIFNKPGNFYTSVIINNQSFLSQVLRVTGLLSEKFNFFSLLGFDIERGSDPERSQIKFHFLIALN